MFSGARFAASLRFLRSIATPLLALCLVGSGATTHLAQAAGPIPGLLLIWPVPAALPNTSSIPLQSYAQFDDGSNERHHAALDIPAPSDTIVVAAASGTVSTRLLNESQNKTHCMGNVLMITHSGGVTLYAHLTSTYKTAGQWVNQGDAIGTVGNTLGIRADDGSCGIITRPHLHFELKANAVLGTTSDDGVTWGYTPEPEIAGLPIPTHHPDAFLYYDPILNLLSGIINIAPTTVSVTSVGGGVSLRTGPDVNYRNIGITTVPNTQYLAIRERAGSTGCDAGWYQIGNIGGAYFTDNVNNSSSNGIPKLPYIWVCKGNGGQIWVRADSSPTLTLTPSTGLSSSGNVGGPFTPGSTSYTISNSGGGTMNWTAAANQNWITVGPQNGSLSAGQSASVTVSINGTANALAAGGHSGSVSFANTNNGGGNTSRAVNLTVNASQQPSCSLSASPTQINAGGSAVLSWTSTNATSGSINNGVGNATPVASGSRTVSPTQTTTYVGTFTGAGGASTTCQTTITVTATQPTVTNVSPNSGSTAGGTPVTITGTNFTGASAVTFGGAAASFNVTNATSISATTPAHAAGAVDVTVTTSAGTGTASSSFTYVASAQPLLSVTPSAGLTSSGNVGGPFSPSSTSYTIQNNGGGTLSWSAAPSQNWITVTQSSGTLTAGQTASVSVSINGNANSLAGGSYSGVVSFTNTTNGTGNASRSVSLTVNTVQQFSGRATFRNIGVPDGSDFICEVTKISLDNTTLIGSARKSDGECQAFRWKGGVFTKLNAGGAASFAEGVNADGKIIIGHTYPTLDCSSFQAFRWRDGQTEALPGIPCGSLAYDINPSGRTVVGSYAAEAYRWDDGAFRLLGTPVGYGSTVAAGVSAGGDVVAGIARNVLWKGRAFRWESGQFQVIEPLPSMDGIDYLAGISADGAIIVGTTHRGDPPDVFQGFRWVNGVTAGLGVLPGYAGSHANGLSGDGQIVVGYSWKENARSGFLWTPSQGMQAVDEVLASKGTNVNGLLLEGVGAVSPDGSRLAGYGYDYRTGKFTIWVACIPRGTPCPSGTAHDFDSTGKSDIVWRENGGQVDMWLMNGPNLAGNASHGVIPPSWQLVAQRDFDGDGKADLLWKDTGGNVALWRMDGTNLVSSTYVYGVAPGWEVAGVGDLDGDGKADIVWRHTSGYVAFWLMDGGTIRNSAGYGTIPTNWTINAVTDFDGDGKADLLWRDTSGNMAMWLMNGTNIATPLSLGNIPPSWQVVATGDFNGDGKADLFWRDTSGNKAIWLMNAGSRIGDGGYGTLAGWEMTLTGDFDGDGKADMLWRHTASGYLAMWFMDGVTIASSAGLGAIPTNWTIQARNAN